MCRSNNESIPNSNSYLGERLAAVRNTKIFVHDMVVGQSDTFSVNKTCNMVIDSGAAEHVAASASLLQDVRDVETPTVILAAESKVTTRQNGPISIDLGNTKLIISSAYYTSNLQLNLIFCSRLDEHRISTLVSEKKCTIMVRCLRNKRLADVPQRDSNGIYIVSALEFLRDKILNLHRVGEKKQPETKFIEEYDSLLANSDGTWGPRSH